MKKIIILHILVLLSAICRAKALDADSLVIHFFTWQVDDAPHIITCSNYETDVPYKEYIISDVSKMNGLNKFLDNLTPTSDHDFSVGCKLLFVKNGVVTDIVCMNRHYVMKNGKVYNGNQYIIDYLDTLINCVEPSINSFNYKPDKYGEEYYKGKSELYKRLSSYYSKLVKKYDISGTTRVEVFCKAYKNGKTKTAKINFFNNNVDSVRKKKIEEDLNKWFLHKVRWKEDKTRMDADWIHFYFKP